MRTYCITQGTQVFCGDLMERKSKKRGVISIADSLTVQHTNTTLYISYTRMKIKCFSKIIFFLTYMCILSNRCMVRDVQSVTFT